ncbi:MAG TPA: type I 3-dehydroquinate dehydratase [Phycisphaerae bacterium]|nr:type I 3-dehydroquinate dehydratase [Phycisphaerae bacterium]HOI56817.1 type I 3-dehydroquinate dehydratase [Phycisphaerae bacterium]
MRRSFLHQPPPVVTGIMAGQTPQELIAESRNAEFDGARGIAIDLADLKPEFRNADALRGIVEAVPLPFMFFFYRNDKWGASGDDQRQELLLAAADAGASMIDVMGDLYDPSPMEITHNAAAIDRQRRLIDIIHARGADVVVSSHMACARTTEQVVEHLLALKSRGADVVKLVATADTDEELAEALRTTIVLKRELKMPFIHLCNGRLSRLHRFFGPALGVSIAFAVHRYEPRYAMTQPTIRAMRAVLDNLHCHLDEAT